MNERDKNKLLRQLKQSKKVKQMIDAGVSATGGSNKKFLFMTEKEFKKLSSPEPPSKGDLRGRSKK